MADARRKAAAVFERSGKPGTTALPTTGSRSSVKLTSEEASDLQVWLALNGQKIGRKLTVRGVFRALLAEMRDRDDQGDLMPDALALEERVLNRLRTQQEL